MISAEGLSKAYRIGAELERAGTLTGAAIGMLKAPVRNFRRLRRLNTYAFDDDSPDIYWALNDVSLEINEGEVVGIIGRNGAGKSTLLKLLSRITDPTRGRAILRGRVSSLLEVGTGFHPELTGRENVYLNGTILGMTKREVDRKFDEIVEFSGVEKFLSTPIKRYSSGMTVRLAFAVAAHLEPEILIVDEVLAVGDIAFQRRCLAKMDAVRREGRTVLFVSHDLSAIGHLCPRTIWLDHGKTKEDDESATVIRNYLSYGAETARSQPLGERTDRLGTGRAIVTSVSIQGTDGTPLSFVCSGDSFSIVLAVELKEDSPLDDVVASIALIEEGRTHWLVRSTFTRSDLSISRKTSGIACDISELALAQGSYSVTAFLSYRDIEMLDCIENTFTLRVEPGDFFGTGSAGLPGQCKVLTRADWRVCERS